MNIDIERLKVDESLWPEGAKYYCTHAKDFHAHQTARDCCIPRPEPRQAEWPEPGSKWEHHSGRVYAVVNIANGNTERPEQYPVTVIYQNVDNGTLWSRPLCEWDRSFKPYRTKEQREKDDLVEFLKQWNGCTIETMATIILTRYNLEPKQ